MNTPLEDVFQGTGSIAVIIDAAESQVNQSVRYPDQSRSEVLNLIGRDTVNCGNLIIEKAKSAGTIFAINDEVNRLRSLCERIESAIAAIEDGRA